MTIAITRDSPLTCNIDRLPPLNPALMKLLMELNQGTQDASGLARIISEDANTSATILKIANSPFYGMNKKIASVRDACMVLGLNNLRNVVYATAIESLDPHQAPDAPRTALQRHCRATAILCTRLAPCLGFRDPGTSYTLGLLHELGKQATLIGYPDYFAAYVQNPAAQPQAPADMCGLGESLAQSWHMPDLIRHTIRHYPHPDNSPVPSQPQVRLVHFAHRLANHFGYCSPGESPNPAARDDTRRYLDTHARPGTDLAALLDTLEEGLQQDMEKHDTGSLAP